MPPQDKQPPEINDEQIKRALLSSGYLLEYRAEQLLKQKGWITAPNHPYADRATGKSRELDLFAFTVETVTEPNINKSYPLGMVLFTGLVIECVNNPQPIALFTKPQNRNLLISSSEEFKFVGVPNEISALDTAPEQWKMPIKTFLGLHDWHHFSSSQKRRQMDCDAR
jgi:hypothetical protein